MKDKEPPPPSKTKLAFANSGRCACWHIACYGNRSFTVAVLLRPPVSALRPACQQVYNLFHPADPSASRLEPLLDKRFHMLPPFSVPRYQRFPLGDGHSALLGESTLTERFSLETPARYLFASPSQLRRCRATLSSCWSPAVPCPAAARTPS